MGTAVPGGSGKEQLEKSNIRLGQQQSREYKNGQRHSKSTRTDGGIQKVQERTAAVRRVQEQTAAVKRHMNGATVKKDPGRNTLGRGRND